MDILGKNGRSVAQYIQSTCERLKSLVYYSSIAGDDTMEATEERRGEIVESLSMSKAMLWFVFALLLVLSLRASATRYIELPLLVNVCASHDRELYDSREEYIKQIKESMDYIRKDANTRLLKTTGEELGMDVQLRLGPIRVEDMEAGPDTVTQGSDETAKLIAKGKKELASKLQNKGIKVYIVNTLLKTDGTSLAGIGEAGITVTTRGKNGEEQTMRHGRVVVLDEATVESRYLLNKGDPRDPDYDPFQPPEVYGKSQFLLHEIGHNAGLVPRHGQNDPQETGLMTSPPSRNINREQWDMLKDLSKRFGNEAPNKQEKTSFVPPAKKTNYCILPEPQWISVPPVDLLTLTLDDTNWLMGQITFMDLLPRDIVFNYEISIAFNTDNNIYTCGLFEEYGQGFDFLVTLYLQNDPTVDTDFTVDGTIMYLNNYQYVTGPLAATHYSEIGSVGMDACIPLASAVSFSHDISAFPISLGNMPVKAKLMKNGTSAGFVTANLKSVSNPSLPLLPKVVEGVGLTTITGQGFTANSSLSLYLTHEDSFAIAPVVTAITDSTGGFSLPLNMEGMILGDYIVTAIDENGNIANGVITVGEMNAQGIFIDDFNIALPALTVSGQNSELPVSKGTTVEDSMLGGEFDVVISLQEVSLPSDGATVEIIDGRFHLRQNATSISQAILVWDGPDHSPFEVQASNGLGGGVDIRGQDAFVLDIVRNDVPLNAAIVLFSSVEDSSELNLSIPAVSEAIPVMYPLSDFSVNGNGVDLANVTAILVFIGPGDGVTGPAHLEIDAIRTLSTQ